MKGKDVLPPINEVNDEEHREEDGKGGLNTFINLFLL